MARTGKSNKAWKELFADRKISLDLEKQGYHHIPAKEINKYREARLMTKVDSTKELPEILFQNNCVPLALTNGEYVLLKPYTTIFHPLENLPLQPEVIPFGKLPDQFKTIPWGESFSTESQAIEAAFLSNITSNFLQEEEISLTIRGRMRLKKKLSLRFNTSKAIPSFQVDGVQLEIDAGYESSNGVYLLEAKREIPQDFNIRQLYYPFYQWHYFLHKRTRHPKPIYVLFLAYSGHSYYLFKYQFNNPEVFNSLEFIAKKWYVLGEPSITLGSIREFIDTTNSKFILDIPFPQADHLGRVIDVVEQIHQEELVLKNELAEHYEITPRQSDYYANAARWLGWVKRSEIGWKTTRSGRRLLRGNLDERLCFIIQTMCERPVTRESLLFLSVRRQIPSREKIRDWIMAAVSESSIKKISNSTVRRRSKTIHSWMSYLFALLKIG